jgi:hypothetical protein
MATTPKAAERHHNTIVVHDTIEDSAYSDVISIGGFKTKQINIATAGQTSGKEWDIDFMVSNQHDVDFESAASISNRWSLCQVKDLISQTASNGTINIADANAIKSFILNTDGFRYLCIKATITGTGHTLYISVDLFEEHPEQHS